MAHASSNPFEKGFVNPYGDPTAFMGNGWYSSSDELIINAPHKFQLGWFPAEKVVTINGGSWPAFRDSTEGGFLKLSAVNMPTSTANHPQVFRISHPDNGLTYYFSWMTSRKYDFSGKILILQ